MLNHEERLQHSCRRQLYRQQRDRNEENELAARVFAALLTPLNSLLAPQAHPMMLLAPVYYMFQGCAHNSRQWLAPTTTQIK